MQFTPLQIKEKLLKALDDDNNVVDAAAVLEVISILEKYPITKDALEQTRIGKHMNELRKKTTNEQLAKRAKKLVRNWQRLVEQESRPQASNGDRVVTPPQHPCVAALQRGGNGSTHPGSLSSPGLTPSGKNSPVPGRKCMSPALAGGRPLTPQARTPKCTSPALSGGKPTTPGLQSSRLSPSLKHSPPPGKPLVPSLQSGRPGQGPRTPQTGGRPNTPTSRLAGARASPVLGNSSRSCSPAVTSPLANQRHVDSPKSHSPNLERSFAGNRPATPSGRSNSRPSTPYDNDDSNSSWPGGTGEHEKNNSNSRIRNKGGLDSKSSAVFSSESNHSKEVKISSDKSSRNDQIDISKTNVANRKRTRPMSPDTVPKKQPKSDSLSKLKCDATVNGVVGTHKHKKKEKGNMNRSNSATSLNYSKPTKETSPVSAPDKTEQYKRAMNSRGESASKTQKASKVKTTKELIAELQKRTGGSNYGNDIMTKINSNQIEKEVDAPRSVLPPGVKPRKKRPSMSSENLAYLDSVTSTSHQSHKNEMMEKFLESSVSHSGGDPLSPYKDENKWESTMDSTNSFESHNDSLEGNVNGNQYESKVKLSTSEPKTDGAEAVDAPKLLSLEEILQLLPPLDVDSVNWEAHEYSLPESVEGTDADVSRLHTDNWEHVNGCLDVNGEWRDWSQTLSRTTQDGDLLHILPYVNIDD